MPDLATRYRTMIRRQGLWAAVRAMRNAGLSLAQARWIVCSRDDYPVLTQRAPASIVAALRGSPR